MTTQRQRLAHIFVELAGGDPDVPLDVPSLLTSLATHGRELADAYACGVFVALDVSPVEAYGTDEGVRRLVLEAHGDGQGPGPDCRRTGEPVPRTDLRAPAARRRWRHFVPRARALGYAQVAARPLRGQDHVIGSLTLFGSDEAPLTDEGLLFSQSLADIVAIALLRERELSRSRTRTGQMERALISRLAIEQAKGVLAAQRSLSVDQAFVLLRGHARAHRRKLADVAREVVEGRLTL